MVAAAGFDVGAFAPKGRDFGPDGGAGAMEGANRPPPSPRTAEAQNMLDSILEIIENNEHDKRVLEEIRSS